MRRIFFFIFLHLIVFSILITSYAYAEEKVFNCKPIFASVQLKNGDYYSETTDDESTPFIDALPVTQFLIDDDDIFYKNNKNRKFEQLIPTEQIFNLNLEGENANVFKSILTIFAKWDEKLNLENFKTFIYPYRSFKENGDYDLSMKRISIHQENYRTSEITVPISEDRPPYFVERSCDGKIQHFFEKKYNRKLS